jgi:signal transduction histidine kinase
MSVHDVLQVIVRSARSLVGARYAALGVPDAGDSFAEFVVDGVSAQEWAAIGPLPRRHGMLGVLLRDGRPERLDNIQHDPRFEGWPRGHFPMTHFLGVPVRDGDQVLGIIFAANKITVKSSGFTERDQEVLTLFATHAAIALTNARLYEQSREATMLTERARLARELHDAVTQKLFSLRAHARAAAVLASRSPSEVAGELAEVESLAAQAHAELRAVIDGLTPPDLAAGGLASSLSKYGSLVSRVHEVPVCVQVPASLPGLDGKTEAAVYRVVQEALHNVLRHAAATSVTVSLTASGRWVVLEVADNGRGFSTGMPGDGLGLASMRERARSVGGTLRVDSAPGSGTTVRMKVPVAR